MAKKTSQEKLWYIYTVDSTEIRASWIVKKETLELAKTMVMARHLPQFSKLKTYPTLDGYEIETDLNGVAYWNWEELN